MYKIIFASDSFKGSLTSSEANRAMAEGAGRAAETEAVCVPISDGGDGLIDCLAAAMGLEIRKAELSGPLYESVCAMYALGGETAVIEMAEASGIILTHGKNNPYEATTFGTGELIKMAIREGAKKIYLGLGGSATTDGGMGALMALGAEFFDENGNKIERGCGRTAAEAASADFSRMLTDGIEIIILCDVDFTLLGTQGAAAVFSPQKGADENGVKFLASALQNYADVICRTQKDYTKISGTGAAGGLGYGLMSVCGAKLVPGMATVMELIGFEKIISGADIVFTGEGKIDFQSSHGKAPGIIARAAKKQGIPVIVIGGRVTEEASALYDCGASLITASSKKDMPLDYAMSHAFSLLADAAESAMRELTRKHSLL